MTALTFAATRSPSYPNTTLPDATRDPNRQRHVPGGRQQQRRGVVVTEAVVGALPQVGARRGREPHQLGIDRGVRRLPQPLTGAQRVGHSAILPAEQTAIPKVVPSRAGGQPLVKAGPQDAPSSRRSDACSAATPGRYAAVGVRSLEFAARLAHSESPTLRALLRRRLEPTGFRSVGRSRPRLRPPPPLEVVPGRSSGGSCRAVSCHLSRRLAKHGRPSPCLPWTSP